MSDELPTPDGIGRFNDFETGGIYWHPDIGAFEVHGAIYDLWGSLGWERSWLGYPTSNELPTSDGLGRISQFQNGYIIWYPDRGATAIPGKAIVRLIVSDMASIKLTKHDSKVDEFYFTCAGSSGTNTFNYKAVFNSMWAKWFTLKPERHAYDLTLWDGHLNDNEVAAIHCLLVEDDAHKIYLDHWGIFMGSGKLVASYFTSNPKLAIEGTKDVINGIESHGNQVVAAFRVVIKKTPQGFNAEWTPLDDTFVNQADNSFASMSAQGGGGEYLLNLSIFAP